MAVTITPESVRDDLKLDITIATRLLAVASALVTKFAPAAPEAIQNEAAMRCVGWLSEAPASGIVSQTTGPFTWQYSPAAHQGALRSSGAMGLLSPWKARRAGRIAGSAS